MPRTEKLSLHEFAKRELGYKEPLLETVVQAAAVAIALAAASFAVFAGKSENAAVTARTQNPCITTDADSSIIRDICQKRAVVGIRQGTQNP